MGQRINHYKLEERLNIWS